MLFFSHTHTDLRRLCVGLLFDAMRIKPDCVERLFISHVDCTIQWAGSEFVAEVIPLLRAVLRCGSFKSVVSCSSPKPHKTAAATATGPTSQVVFFTPFSLDERCRKLTEQFCDNLDKLLTYGLYSNQLSNFNKILSLYTLEVSGDHVVVVL